MDRTLVFIHGMFMNPKSWEAWLPFFESKGYTCHAPAWPYHKGEPEALRTTIDPSLGTLTFAQVVNHIGTFISTLPGKPILIGHSMGGLVVQKLIEQNKGAAGICIDTAPPKSIFSLKWSFLKSNVPTVSPFAGNSPCIMNAKRFHYTFCNTMSMEDTQRALNAFVVPESRNVARSSSGSEGSIDFEKPHAPLLFIAGEKDHIIPASLNKKNFEAYSDAGGKKEFKEFSSRSHFICGQPGWEAVAAYIHNWLNAL